MLRNAVALLLAVMAVDCGVLRSRLAADLPNQDDVLSAYDAMADMKLAEVAKVLRKNNAVRFSVQRAAMDISENKNAQSYVQRLAKNPEVNQLVNNVMSQRNKLTVRDLSNLRQNGSPALKQSVRSALDSLMADESSRPLATHLKQAWDAESLDEQLEHLNMALDVLDSSPSSYADPADAPKEAYDPEGAYAASKADAADAPKEAYAPEGAYAAPEADEADAPEGAYAAPEAEEADAPEEAYADAGDAGDAAPEAGEDQEAEEEEADQDDAEEEAVADEAEEEDDDDKEKNH